MPEGGYRAGLGKAVSCFTTEKIKKVFMTRPPKNIFKKTKKGVDIYETLWYYETRKGG